jgi:RNA polymerase sigma factor (sigma-70 family)
MDVVASMLAGDSRGRSVAYDKYADGLHTYCLSLLRHHDAAAEALHATFIVAVEHVGRLRDPARLRPWLYAVARNECLRRRVAGYPAVVREQRGEADEALVGLERSLRRAELRSLLWKGAEGLQADDREVLELSVRHGMDVAELGAVLRVKPDEAHRLLAAAWKELEWSVTVLHVVEHGRSACAELALLLDGWDENLTVLMRRQVGPHIWDCPICAKQLPESPGGLDLQVGLPIVAAPRALREKVLADVGVRRLAREHQQTAKLAGPFDAEGFPVRWDRVPAALSRARRWRWAAAAVVPGAVALGAALLWYTDVDARSVPAAVWQGRYAFGGERAGGSADAADTETATGRRQLPPATQQGFPGDPAVPPLLGPAHPAAGLPNPATLPPGQAGQPGHPGRDGSPAPVPPQADDGWEPDRHPPPDRDEGRMLPTADMDDPPSPSPVPSECLPPAAPSAEPSTGPAETSGPAGPLDQESCVTPEPGTSPTDGPIGERPDGGHRPRP